MMPQTYSVVVAFTIDLVGSATSANREFTRIEAAERTKAIYTRGQEFWAWIEHPAVPSSSHSLLLSEQ